MTSPSLGLLRNRPDPNPGPPAAEPPNSPCHFAWKVEGTPLKGAAKARGRSPSGRPRTRCGARDGGTSRVVLIAMRPRLLPVHCPVGGPLESTPKLQQLRPFEFGTLVWSPFLLRSIPSQALLLPPRLHFTSLRLVSSQLSCRVRLTALSNNAVVNSNLTASCYRPSSSPVADSKDSSPSTLANHPRYAPCLLILFALRRL